MKTVFLIILGLFVFGMSHAFADDSIDLLVSPLVGEILVPGVPHDVFIIRDIKHSLTWELAHPDIEGLDYVEGNTYLISAKKSISLPFFEYPKYKLLEIQQIFKSHEPYSWQSLCAPGYNTWDGVCVFAFRCSEYAYPGKLCTTGFTEQDYLRPLQQEQVGILPEDVICLESLQLVINHNNTPACVSSSSIDKLLERGFTLVKSNNDSPYH